MIAFQIDKKQNFKKPMIFLKIFNLGVGKTG